LTQTAILGTLKLMKGEKLILVIVAIVTIALIGALVFIGADKNTSSTPNPENRIIDQEETSPQAVDELRPTETQEEVLDNTNEALGEFDLVVSRIEDSNIVLAGGPKEILVPIDEALVQVMMVAGGKAESAEFADIAKGMKAQLKLVDSEHLILTLIDSR